MTHQGNVYITRGTELWVTNGTAAGTEFITNTRDNPVTNPIVFAKTESHLFFTVSQELWKTDGTVDGTSRVGRLRSSSEAPALAVLNDEITLCIE